MYFTENPLKRQSNKINMVDAQNHNVGLWFWENFRDTLVNFTVYQLAGRTATSSGELSMINSYRKLLPAQSWGKTTSLWQFHPKLNLKKKFSSHLCSTINYCWQKIVPSEIRLIMFNGGGDTFFQMAFVFTISNKICTLNAHEKSIKSCVFHYKVWFMMNLALNF